MGQSPLSAGAGLFRAFASFIRLGSNALGPSLRLCGFGSPGPFGQRLGGRRSSSNPSPKRPAQRRRRDHRGLAGAGNPLGPDQRKAPLRRRQRRPGIGLSFQLRHHAQWRRPPGRPGPPYRSAAAASGPRPARGSRFTPGPRQRGWGPILLNRRLGHGPSPQSQRRRSLGPGSARQLWPLYLRQQRGRHHSGRPRFQCAAGILL